MRPSRFLLALSAGAVVTDATNAHNHANPTTDLQTDFKRDLALTLSHDNSARSIEARSIIDKLLNDLEMLGNGFTCKTCEAVFSILKTATVLGDDIVLGIVQALCEVVGIFTGTQIKDICSGSVALEGPILTEVLRDMVFSGNGMKLLCNFLYGLCPQPKLNWEVSLPPSRNATRPAPSGKKPIQIVQYSDLHVDPEYTTGAATNCSNPIICCRSYSKKESPGNNDSPASAYGEHKCDPPARLQESMFRAIKSVAPDAAFTIFTGDIVEHAIWNTTKQGNQLRINQNYDSQSSFFDLVYAVVGNHEASPVNSFPARAVAEEYGTQWVFETVAAHWQKWIGNTTQVIHDGSYSVKYPRGNLRVISLDTNYYYNTNFWVYDDPIPQDPNGQFGWLVGELDSAEKAKERVYIIGHMPMGDVDSLRHYSNAFDQIVNRYSSTIAAMFWGHTHYDHFEISYSDYAHKSPSTASAVGYICPALTPLEGMPAFRIYDVDPDTFAVIDHTTYIANMDDASFGTDPVWTKEYSAKEAYGSAVPIDSAAEMSSAWWHNVTEAFKGNQTLFQEYYARKSRGWAVKECTGGCRTNEICQLQAGRSEDNCKPSQVFTVSPHEGGQGTHCGSSVTMMMLQGMQKKDVRKKLRDSLKAMRQSQQV